MTRQPKRELTLFDSTCLIVGIIIGAGIYQMAPAIAQGTDGVWGLLGIWLLGGVLSLCGAMSYAELATAYPREGGDYVYLTRAYGSWAGFLFGWAQLAVVRPGDIAVMAFAFATYARVLWDPLGDTNYPHMQQLYAVGATGLFTAINVWGVRQGKWTQNLLTTAKGLGLLLVVLAAFCRAPAASVPGNGEAAGLPFSLALIFVLFVFGGWNEMAYVAAEVRDPRRNIARALILGTVAVTVLYLVVNVAFVHALGFGGVQQSEAVATETVGRVLPRLGAALISGLICISALGALNGLVFTGARISYAVGQEHALFQALGRWHPRWGTPAAALIVQGLIAMLLIVVLGSFVEAVLYTAAAVYTFYGASSLAVLVLRRKEPEVERPFRVPWYPVPPILFAAVCGFLIHAAATYKPSIALVGVVLLLVGVWIWLRANRPPEGG